MEQQPAAVFLTGFPGAKQDAVDPGLYELKDAVADDERQSAGSFPAPRFGCGTVGAIRRRKRALAHCPEQNALLGQRFERLPHGVPRSAVGRSQLPFGW